MFVQGMAHASCQNSIFVAGSTPTDPARGSSTTPEQAQQQQQQPAQLINPSRRSLMMVVPLMAAAAAGVPNAQAADEFVNMEDTCLECAGIGITPCE
jgi:hypothetical protein